MSTRNAGTPTTILQPGGKDLLSVGKAEKKRMKAPVSLMMAFDY